MRAAGSNEHLRGGDVGRFEVIVYEVGHGREPPAVAVTRQSHTNRTLRSALQIFWEDFVLLRNWRTAHLQNCENREGDAAGAPARAACGSALVQQGGGNWQHLLHLILYVGGIWQAQYGHEVRCEDGVGHDCRDRG